MRNSLYIYLKIACKYSNYQHESISIVLNVPFIEKLTQNNRFYGFENNQTDKIRLFV